MDWIGSVRKGEAIWMYPTGGFLYCLLYHNTTLFMRHKLGALSDLLREIDLVFCPFLQD